MDNNSILVWIFLGIVIFFILRELNVWYWKINEIVNKLDSINNTLKSIDFRLGNNDEIKYDIIDEEKIEQDNIEKEEIRDISIDNRTTIQKIKDLMNS